MVCDGESPAFFARGLALLSLLLFSFAPQANAQDDGRQDSTTRRQQEERGAQDARRARRDGSNLLLQLNLSPEQLAQMREIRRQSEPEARTLMRRLNLARRALDEAIYSDSLDEALIERHMREVAEAQAALVRLRARTELRVRRVLSPEQLQSFRELRQRARFRQRLEKRFGGDARRTPQDDAPDDDLKERPDAPADEQRDSRPFRAPRERRRGGFRRQP
ncbi:MAG TPA: Spy/CpxP family protein refolding chaperone [Pyrinomonadaceae bacterium]|nr:Spy/CpxP family protein refolding chaperone [Pyrinomonadaceae bacterium]